MDVLTIFGTIGVFGTILGLIFTLVQLQKTRNASNAALDALEESRRHYNKYVVAQSHRMLSEARTHINQKNWAYAALKLGDLAELLSQVADGDATWGEMAQQLHEMEHSFWRVQREESRYSNSFSKKWHALDGRIRKKIGKHTRPFEDSEGARL